MRLGASWNKREQDELNRHVQRPAYLKYNFVRNNYEICVKPKGSPSSKVLRAIPRLEMTLWSRPLAVIDYVSRRALYEAGYPTEFRIKR